jgi:hypothetical protein
VPADKDSGKAVYHQALGHVPDLQISNGGGLDRDFVTRAAKEISQEDSDQLGRISETPEWPLNSVSPGSVPQSLSTFHQDQQIVRSRLLVDSDWSVGFDGGYAYMLLGGEDGRLIDLLAAPTACYAAWQSRFYATPALEAIGLYSYHKGLVSLRSAITQPSAALSDAVLAACLSLMDYEIFECPDLHMMPYRWHRDACAKIIKLRGPERHQSGAGHELFLRFRIHAILDALESRRPNFVCSRTWKILPFVSTTKDVFDELLDVITEAPATLALVDDLHELDAEDAIKHTIKIARRLVAQQSALDHFHNSLELQHGQLFQEIDRPLDWSSGLQDLSEPQGQDLEPEPFVPFQFATPDLARTLPFFWAFEAMMWSGISVMPKSAFAALGKASKGFEKLDRDTCDEKWQKMCRNVCQSVDHFTLNYALNPSARPGRISAPLNIIINVMQQQRYVGEELQWAIRTRERIGRRWLRMLCVHRETDT